jgi:ABC-type polar amino acid transport system ATPase subunit
MPNAPRLSRIKFKAGPRPGATPLEVNPGTVVVFVGPNNSGKSLSLREIEDWAFGVNTDRDVVDSIDVDFPTDPTISENLLRRFESSPPENQVAAPGHFWIGQHTFRSQQAVRHLQVDAGRIREATTNRETLALRELLCPAYTVRLDGRTRFSLADPKPSGDLQQHPQNHLWALFKDDVARERVRSLTEDAFGLHFVVDPTGMTQFRIRMSSRAPTTKAEEQALDDAARRFHHDATEIGKLSDGVQAFVGLTSALMSLPHTIILIDEPEAFLHPPLARRLGSNLARISRERDASLVAATHSSEFLIGCLEAVGDTSVIRFTYESSVATARALSSTQLKDMTRDPLLRSTGVLRALFHRAAVITEADGDRAFYDEMNRRLLMTDRGIADALFLNAQNKQTVRRLVEPLRSIGIPAVAIVDLDVIKEAGTNWERLLDACQVPAARRTHLEGERAHLNGVFAGLPTASGGQEQMKVQGISALNATDKARAESLLRELASHGLFVTPGGQLETWLSHLAIADHGSNWLIKVFSQIGQSESDANYLQPATGDVWEFIDNIAGWVNNPERLGTN